MLTEGRNHGISDMLKTYSTKTLFGGGCWGRGGKTLKTPQFQLLKRNLNLTNISVISAIKT